MVWPVAVSKTRIVVSPPSTGSRRREAIALAIRALASLVVAASVRSVADDDAPGVGVVGLVDPTAPPGPLLPPTA